MRIRAIFLRRKSVAAELVGDGFARSRRNESNQGRTKILLTENSSKLSESGKGGVNVGLND
jgi:hypothetical protein